MINIQSLIKNYGKFNAVNNISFSVLPGEIFAFLGVNGAGKTTTLKILAGILSPTSGKITIGGFDIEKEPLKAKAIIGFIPDRPYLYPKLTAKEFLEFIGEIYSIPLEELYLRIEEVLSEYGLTDWKNELIESFSHGMKQRLATCAGILHKPKVLIVDEPMVGLDPHGALLLKKRLRSYAESGQSVLLSTHSLNVAEEIADKIAIIDKGAIIAIGTLAEIREKFGEHTGTLERIFLQITDNSASTN